jgi:hypothetical protein
MGTEFDGALTASDTSDLALTVIAAGADSEPEEALTLTVPAETPVTLPEGETVATLVEDEDHVTVSVKSRVLLSLYTPVTCSWTLAPIEIAVDVGEIEIETSAAWGGLTLTVAVPITPLSCAEMVAAPDASASTDPTELTAATEGAELLHVTDDVRSREMPSL